MRVILREDVHGLGDVGDIVEVKPGYGRNYLLPQGLAVLADPKNVRRIEHEQRLIAKRLESMKAEAAELSGQLEGLSVTIPRKAGEMDKLFGSVTVRDIADALAIEGVEVDRKRIRLQEPIKTLGVYKVTVRLHPEVTPEVMVWVTAE